MENIKEFSFKDNKNNKNCEEISIDIYETMDGSYENYVWPSSPVLAEYVWQRRDSIKDKTVLEVF